MLNEEGERMRKKRINKRIKEDIEMRNRNRRSCLKVRKERRKDDFEGKYVEICRKMKEKKKE